MQDNKVYIGEEKAFHYQDLLITLHPEVYDPAEDTFLLLETIDVKPSETVFEIGTGCGIIALVCAKKGAYVICSDVNPYAVSLTKKNIKQNQSKLKGGIEVRYGDMFSVLQPEERFDVIIFNPPYLPTSREEKTGGWFDIAVDGGIDGFKLVKPFLRGISMHLKINGRGYFVSTSLVDQWKLENLIKKQGLTYKRIATQYMGEEDLYIYQVKIYE